MATEGMEPGHRDHREERCGGSAVWGVFDHGFRGGHGWGRGVPSSRSVQSGAEAPQSMTKRGEGSPPILVEKSGLFFYLSTRSVAGHGAVPARCGSHPHA